VTMAKLSILILSAALVGAVAGDALYSVGYASGYSGVRPEQPDAVSGADAPVLVAQLSVDAGAAHVGLVPTSSADAPSGIATSPAVAPVVLPSDPGGLAWLLVTAAKDGNWRIAAAAVLSLLMLGLSYTPVRSKLFKGDRGGAILVLLLAVAGGVVTALVASVPISGALLLGSIGVAFTAAGGYQIIKRIIWPATEAAK